MSPNDALEQRAYVQKALGHLRMARDLLKKADAPRATEKTRRAMKSAEGALRNVSGREFRAERDAPTLVCQRTAPR